MSVVVTPSTLTIPPTFTQQLQASGGVAPYTWSVAPGGAGGTIDADGLYTAPLGVGIDLIIATDSNAEEGYCDVIVDNPLTLLPSLGAIGVNQSQPFAAVGGTPPYQYSLVNGVGYVDPDSGLYHSESSLGSALIQVIDDLGASAQARVMVGSPLQLLCEIIQREMDLEDGRVYLWDQKINAPTDNDLFIVVGILTCKPFGNTSPTSSDETGLNEVQSVNMHSVLTVDVISRSMEAVLRKEEVLMAIASAYSQQQQSLNSFRIFPLTNRFVNLSEIDGSAIPYRFNIHVSVQYMVTKTKPVEYFDTFTREVVIDD